MTLLLIDFSGAGIKQDIFQNSLNYSEKWNVNNGMIPENSERYKIDVSSNSFFAFAIEVFFINGKKIAAN